MQTIKKTNNMNKIKIQDLQIHPELGNLEVSKNQLEKMTYLLRKFGQIQPILIYEKDGNSYVIDGIIRLAAAKHLQWETIDAMKIDWQGDEIIQKRCFSNHSSKRTHWNLAFELNLFMNNLIGKHRGKKRHLQEIVHLLESIKENDKEKVIGDINLLAIEFYGLPFGKSTLRMLMRMYEKHQDAPQELLDLKLFEKIDNEDISISRAFDLTMGFFETISERGNNALTDVIAYSRNPINGDTKHQVYCHTNEDLSFLEDHSIQTFITSPGYFGKQAKYSNAEKNFIGTLHGNEKTVEEYIQKEVEVYRGLKSKLKKDGSLFVVIGNAFRGDDNCIPERLVVAMLNDGWHCPSRMLWAKGNQKPQKVLGRLQPVGEHVLHFTLERNHKWREFVNWTDAPIRLGRTTGEDYVDGIKRPGFYLKRPYERFRTFLEEQKFVGVLKQNCFNVDEVIEFGKPEHPCPFPINLAMFLILMTTDIGDVVGDIYGGIGSTSHAAKILHRNSVSIDVDWVSSNYAVNRIASCEHDVLKNDELEELEGIFYSNSITKVKTAA
jgi:site-specific DNA-methyltransferase (adenine-specific)